MELKVFNFNEKQVRTLQKDNHSYFCLVDVCKILDINNASQLKIRLTKDGVITNEVIDSLGRKQQATFINESNLYKTIFHSRKEEAEQFTEWVTSEVLPSIRKNGGYISNQENLSPEQIVANALVVAQNIIDKQNKKLIDMQPKVEFFDTVTQSEDLMDIKQVASILNLGYGRNKLFAKLRDLKVLNQYNMPYQKYLDRDYFKVVETKIDTKSGVKVFPKTCVYQKGLDFIRKAVIG